MSTCNHKFEPRYNTYVPELSDDVISDFNANWSYSSDIATIIKSMECKEYICDVCVNCGLKSYGIEQAQIEEDVNSEVRSIKITR